MFVITHQKEKIPINVQPDDYIETILTKLKDQVDVPMENISLNWAGNKLDDSQTLKHYSIPNNAKLLIQTERSKGKYKRL